LIAAAIMLAMSGIVCIAAVTKKGDFRGKFEIKFFKKGAGGQWEEADKWVSNASFRLSAVDLAFGKEFTTESVWEGRTEKGRQVFARLSRPGKAKIDFSEGTIQAEIALDVTVDGTKLSYTFTPQTGSVQGPFGTISGRRAVFNGSELTASVVESKELKVPAHLLKLNEGVNRLVVDVVDAVQERKSGATKPPATGKRERTNQPESARTTETILLVGKLEGTFSAVD
jgi:hypothetical protein